MQVRRDEFEALSARVWRLELAAAGEPGVAAGDEPRPAAHEAWVASDEPRFEAGEARRAPGGPRFAAPALAMEDLLGARVLAWAGGVAVLAGIAFLFAIAVSRGWVGEEARVLLATGAALALGAAGVRLRERGGRGDAALAAGATSIAALFLTVTVAAQVYELVPAWAGVLLVLAVSAAATALAIRWQARGIGALGLLGGLCAPILAGAPGEPATLALLWPAAAAATAVVLWQRWPWLSWGVALLPAVTLGDWLLQEPAGPEIVAVLLAFAALNAVAAVGFEVRTRARTLRVPAGLLLVLNGLGATAVGWIALDRAGVPLAADAWVAALALSHLGFGVAALRGARVPRDLALLVLATGVVLADVATGLLLDGAPRAVAYAGGAVVAAVLARRSARDEPLLGAALAGHLALGIGQSVLGPAAPEVLVHGGAIGAAGAVSLLAVAGGCLVAGRLAPQAWWRVAVDAAGLAVVAYAAALALDGPVLVAAYAAEAAALAAIARRGGGPQASWGAAAYAGLALTHGLAFEVPPAALLHGVADPLGAALALGAAAFGALAATRAPLPRAPLAGTAAATLLYLASVLVVDAFPHDPDAGQLALSALWAGIGTVAAVVGLHGRIAPARRAGLALLLVALGKVALYDLAALPSLYRVGSCVVLGLLLLLVAFAWQRMRPAALECRVAQARHDERAWDKQ